ncbi:MAG TPA: Ig-like domain-containing protein [Verrucomicrobiae bacterium]
MKHHRLLLLACFFWLACGPAEAQTKLSLASIVPGSENVQLVYNGDFQFQGPATATNTHPFPIGWTRLADIYADPGTNLVTANGGVIARALVSGGAAVCMYSRVISLAPNTDYFLSAYLWNMGDAANRVTTVIDLNDAPGEAQLTLSYPEANADQGYFAYRQFNTGNTGSNVTLRVFYDGRTGSGAAARHWPLAAQWDNVAITSAADFMPPKPVGSAGNLRPVVSITYPADGMDLVMSNSAEVLAITASAADYDGSVTKVTFFAGTTKLGEAAASPYSLAWNIPASGSYQLTAVATDNQGTNTVSAPVALTATLAPVPARLHIERSEPGVLLSWPTSATALSLISTSNLNLAASWQAVTNPVGINNGEFTVAVSNTGPRRFFGLGLSVDPTTLDRKLMMGYQGWFACPGDGSALNRWVHWFRNNTPAATNATVDFWPDIAELEPDELFNTLMTLPGGGPARVYSPYKQKTVVRHFRWMKDNNLDGVFLQRFSSSLANPDHFAFRNQVTTNVRLGAETYGRVFAIMYDISGQNAATLVSTLTNDWAYLVNTLRVVNSPSYVRHNGKPVVAIWGFGFTDRPGTPGDALTVINWFKAAGCTVMGGVPTNWRTLQGDSQTNAAWAGAYRAFDIISPWAVGRYSTLGGADTFKYNYITPDLAECRNRGIAYMPVVFPGFSWHNLKGDPSPLNQIPRNGGTFYWRQVYNAISAGCTMIYGAMYDEVDEGTAMFKMAPTPNQLPVEGTFVPLNIDGQVLPSDWYLRLADQASRMLRRDIPLQALLPIRP